MSSSRLFSKVGESKKWPECDQPEPKADRSLKEELISGESLVDLCVVDGRRISSQCSLKAITRIAKKFKKARKQSNDCPPNYSSINCSFKKVFVSLVKFTIDRECSGE